MEHLIYHADEIGSVPSDVAKRAVQLSKEFESNLPPLLLTFNGGREGIDYEVRRSMRRVRRKSATFSGRPCVVCGVVLWSVVVLLLSVVLWSVVVLLFC